MKRIPLTGKRGIGKYAIVSDEDFLFLSQWTWNATPKGYAIRTDRSSGHKLTIYLHRVIFALAFPESHTEQIDHIDGNKLNDLRDNLRACTNQLNQANVPRQKNNSSGFKGVSWHKGHRKYQARIGVNGRRITLGSYGDPEAAHAAYCQAAKIHFGEFARTR